MDMDVSMDVNYLAKESNLNSVLAGMMALLNDTDKKVEMMQNQTWFQRMIKTVLKKNKATKEEIKQNHDVLSLYMVKAMEELYTRGCIDEKAILHLSGQLNDVYLEQVELKKLLADFVSKLNEKIVSVDNYNMLLKEIEQDKYKDDNSIITILRILAQLDDYFFKDARKIEILRKHLIQNNYINSEMISFVSCLERIMELDYDFACQLYFEFGSIRSDFVCDLLIEMVESYHFLPEMQKQLINKGNVLDTFIREHNLNQSSSICSEHLFDSYINRNMLGHNVEGSIVLEEDVQNQIEMAEDIEENCQELDAFQMGYSAFMQYDLVTARELLLPFVDDNYLATYMVSVCCSREYKILDMNYSMEILEKAYLKDDPLCSVRYAHVFCSDENRKKSILAKYEDDLVRLCEEGNIFAKYEYALVYADNTDVSCIDRLQSLADSFWFAKFVYARRKYLGINCEKNVKDAFNIFSSKLFKNDEYCMYYLAEIYYYGKDNVVEVNKKKAVDLYLKAAQGGYDCWYDVVWAYLKGDGIEKNVKLAKEYAITCLKPCEIPKEYGDGIQYTHYEYNSITGECRYPWTQRKNVIKDYGQVAYLLHTIYLEEVEYRKASDALCLAASHNNKQALIDIAKMLLIKHGGNFLFNMFNTEVSFHEGEMKKAEVWFGYDTRRAKEIINRLEKMNLTQDEKNIIKHLKEKL